MRTNPEAIDTRLVFRVYSWIALAGGISAFVAASPLVRDWSRLGPAGAATVGLAGAISWAFASYAAAFSRVDDPASRLSGLREFAVAHAVVAIFLISAGEMIRSATAGLGPSDAFVPAVQRLLATNLLITAAVLFYLAFTANPGPRFSSSIRSWIADSAGPPREFVLLEKAGPASLRRLRSQYEEQIRLAARQEERTRLARDLHDAVKQQLFVVQTAAATIDARIDADPAGARTAVEQVRAAAREAMGEMEAMLDQLQAAPIENLGLVEALKRQAEALGFRTGATIDLDIEPWPTRAPLPPGAQQAIFRIAQEALANIGRHARAAHVTLRLGAQGRRLVLHVSDDGAGFDPLTKRTGMGITNMQQRAAEVGGQFELSSSPGRGTTVTFVVPFIGRSAAAYLWRAVAAAAVLVLSAIAGPWADGMLRAVRLALVWIAILAVVRYTLAYVRVLRREQA